MKLKIAIGTLGTIEAMGILAIAWSIFKDFLSGEAQRLNMVVPCLAVTSLDVLFAAMVLVITVWAERSLR